jgi:hypothetical protein
MLIGVGQLTRFKSGSLSALEQDVAAVDEIFHHGECSLSRQFPTQMVSARAYAVALHLVRYLSCSPSEFGRGHGRIRGIRVLVCWRRSALPIRASRSRFLGPTVKHNLNSAAKSVISLLVGIAIERRWINDLDTSGCPSHPSFTVRVARGSPLPWTPWSRAYPSRHVDMSERRRCLSSRTARRRRP